MRIQKNDNNKNSTIANLLKKLNGGEEEVAEIDAVKQPDPPKQDAAPEKPEKVADEDRAIPPRIGRASRSGAHQGSTGYGFTNYDDMLKRLGKQS